MRNTDLRVRNLVLYDGEIEEIHGVMHGEDGLVYLTSKQGSTIETGVNKVTPIPLTAEWLERFGFKKAGAGFVKHPVWVLPVTGDTVLEEAVGSGAIDGPVIRHVHKLQNLYFTLTGEELTVKA